MYDVSMLPVSKLFKTDAAVSGELCVHGFNYSLTGKDRDHTRHAVDKTTSSAFALAERFLRQLTFGDFLLQGHVGSGELHRPLGDSLLKHCCQFCLADMPRRLVDRECGLIGADVEYKALLL